MTRPGPNLHVALAIALRRPTSWSDAALIDDLEKRLRQQSQPWPPSRTSCEPVLFDVAVTS